MGCFIQADSGVESRLVGELTGIAAMNANTSIKPTAIDETESPFLLDNESTFQAWKQRKLQLRQALSPLEQFPLSPATGINLQYATRIKNQIDAFNFIVFESDPTLSRSEFLQLNQCLGMRRIDQNPGAEDDAVTLLQGLPDGDPRANYIPYTDRAMNWHTDGYYNPPERNIKAFSLFCVTAAAEGGANFLLDHEYVYLLLRDTDPESLAVLMSPDFMCVPANETDDTIMRDEQSGPVFAVDPENGRLHMRYTSRPRHLIWKEDSRSQHALECLREILHDSDAIVDLHLSAGLGLICNNILHGRQAYRDTDQDKRLLYRARFLDSIDPRPA